METLSRPARKSYWANSTTVTDQATKQRRSITDGLGRLTRVDEPNTAGSLGTVASPTQPTSYVYDVSDDLTGVTQGGQTRTFTYDSLKRLKQAINPESGTMNYTYDANSNLQTKQDARSITTTYFYDALNRVTKRTYTDSTPEVDYYYDNQTLPTTKPPNFAPAYSKGRLIAVCYGGPTSSAGSYQSYDQLGRVTSSYQQTDSQNYGFGYGYNLASEMTSETYPSGRQVITEYDTAGRAAGIRSATIYYAGATTTDTTNRIQYAPQGAVSVMKLGNGKWEHTNFNSRLQPTQIGLGTSGTDSSLLKLDYGYGTTSNNGNMISQIITAPSLTVNHCCGYDSLNRLTSAEEKSGGTACAGTQQWKQAFTYDRFGNRNFDLVNTSSNVLGPNPTISQSTNRIASGQNYGYDTAGNLTSDPATNTNGILYDAENRQTQYTKSGQATNSYYYDGDGHRIKKLDSSGTTVFVYNAGGQLIAEYTAGNPSSGGTSYLTTDHLGSTRLVIKSDGTTTRHDYLPFGEDIQAGIGGRTTGQGYVADGVRQKFTQKERDTESGLDYFLARYYSSAHGRFTGADQPFVNIYRRDPQSWNLYTYTRNNPLLYVDRTGNDYDIFDKDGKSVRRVTDAELSSLDTNTIESYSEDGKTIKFKDGSIGRFFNNETGDSVTTEAGDPFDPRSSPETAQLIVTARWINEHIDDKGTVPDETQSPLSRVFGQRRIPYQKVVTTDYVSYWAGEAMLNPVIGAKADIKLINWIVKEQGLSLVQRELLHEEINAVTRMGGGKLTKEAIIELAKQVANDYPNK